MPISPLIFVLFYFNGIKKKIEIMLNHWSSVIITSHSVFISTKKVLKQENFLFFFVCRYIYLPLGGSRHGLLCKMAATGLAFGYVCFWHGGHGYLQLWALMNWAGVLVENGLKSLLSSSFIRALIVSVRWVFLSSHMDLTASFNKNTDVLKPCLDISSEL